MEKIKVLYLITSLGKGGAERSVTDLCLEFNNLDGIECAIGVLYPINQFPDATARLKVFFLNHKPNRLLKKNYTKKYHRLISDFNPDIIHSNLFMAEFLTLEYLSKDIIYVCHGRDNMKQLANFSWKTFFSKTLLLNFIEKSVLVFRKYQKFKTYFVTNSTDTYSYFKKSLPRKLHSNINIIHNGVNLDKFFFTAERNISNKEKIKIINIGSFQAKKNQIFAIDIANELIRRKIQFEIHFLGDGSEKNKVIQYAEKKGVSKNLIFHGNIDKVEEYLFTSDIYIHTAYYEPFGIVLLEAMASGLPIVALDGKGNRDIVQNNYNGFLINEQKAELFADKIEELTGNNILYNEISQNAKEFSLKFGMKNKANEYLQFYRKILKIKPH